MPPKPKYTKEQIVTAALQIVSQKGTEALTSKELARTLNTSTSPIFTVFNSMTDVLDEVKKAAMRRFEDYARKSENNNIPVFKQIGMQMIMFAKKEPRLYRLVFMSAQNNVKSFDDIYARLGNTAEKCLIAIQKDYGLSPQNAKILFQHSWIHTFGIGVLCATGMCDFSEEQISKMLTQDFTAMIQLLKTNKE